MALLFALGSFLFVLGSVPVFFEHVDATVVGATFFIGSVFFTGAATMQVRMATTAAPLFAWRFDRVNWWSGSVQWVGTLWFNISTCAALIAGLSATAERRLVWGPDFIGSGAFLASSALALVALALTATTRRDRGIAALNMLGSVAFGIAAITAFVLPTTGEPVNIRWVNLGTAIGGICFLAASVWMLPRAAPTLAAASDRDE